LLKGYPKKKIVNENKFAIERVLANITITRHASAWRNKLTNKPANNQELLS